MNNGLSTFTEILARGEIYNIQPSSLRENVFIVTFVLGDQANVDQEVYNNICVDNLLKAA